MSSSSGFSFSRMLWLLLLVLAELFVSPSSGQSSRGIAETDSSVGPRDPTPEVPERAQQEVKGSEGHYAHSYTGKRHCVFLVVVCRLSVRGTLTDLFSFSFSPPLNR